jgi:hypothetical protein
VDTPNDELIVLADLGFHEHQLLIAGLLPDALYAAVKKLRAPLVADFRPHMQQPDYGDA